MPTLIPADYPSLAQFLLGYLHQDFRLEYLDPREAAAAFAREASPEQRTRVAAEFRRLLEVTAGWRFERLCRALRRDLGMAWQPPSRVALRRLLAEIEHATKGPSPERPDGSTLDP